MRRKMMSGAKDLTTTAAVRLLEPADGSVTAPLQRFRWPADVEQTAAAAHHAVTTTVYKWNDLEVQELATDRTVPEAVRFAWNDPAATAEATTYTVNISRFPDFREAVLVRDLQATQVEVLHLHIATRYFWKVAASVDRRDVRQSPVWSFITHDALPRWIAAPGITNVRDLGGWPLPGGRRVRQGRAYRSSEMNSHLQISDAGMRLLVEQLGIRTDLDLRGSNEEVGHALDPERVDWINISIEPYEAISNPYYFAAYRRIFELFAEPSRYPILFHCWGGADRAGTVAFLLNALLGNSSENLIMDYELTSLSIWGERHHASKGFQALLEALRPFAPETGDLAAAVEGYLLAIGVTREMIHRIRTLMIEDDPASVPAPTLAIACRQEDGACTSHHRKESAERRPAERYPFRPLEQSKKEGK